MNRSPITPTGYEDKTLYRIALSPHAAPGEARPLVLAVTNGPAAPSSPFETLAGALSAHQVQVPLPVDSLLTGAREALTLLSKIVDSVSEKADVDADALVLVAADVAGYWVLEALTREHRFAAAIVCPGVFAVAEPMWESLSPSLQKSLVEGDADAFNRGMALVQMFASPASAIGALSRSLNLPGELTWFEVYRRLDGLRLDNVLDHITTPVLICDDPRSPWAPQSARLHERLPHLTHLLPGARTAISSTAITWITHQIGAHLISPA